MKSTQKIDFFQLPYHLKFAVKAFYKIKRPKMSSEIVPYMLDLMLASIKSNLDKIVICDRHNIKKLMKTFI